MKRTSIGLAAVAALLFAPASAAAAPAPGTLVQRPVHSNAPDAGKVSEYFVRVYDPLPASAPPHPARCDWITYLRFRDADGPAGVSAADALIVTMPGFLAGASDFDQVARNAIRDAAARGKTIEYWGLDRRSNCLEDNSGLRAAARLRDPAVAYRYYWGHAQANGHRFAGFLSHRDAAVVDNFGLARTEEDWYTVLRTGTPSRRWRSQHVICGGHSLGGPLTAAFAAWDFDGDPRTRSDAGYRQCAGLLGFDTSLTIGSPGGNGLDIDPTGALLTLATSDGAPYIDIPALNPETFQVPGVFGIGAYFHPQSTELLDDLPQTLNVNLAQRLLFSRDAVNFATGIPSIRDFTVTNQVTLAGVFDDNSAPLFFLRSSVGSLVGGPVVDKNFPAPDPTAALPGDTSTPLYSWERYDKVGLPGHPLVLNEEGDPYTSRESEVSDIDQLARAMYEAPANFIEQYFPTRILTDVSAAGTGDRTGSLAGLRYDGVSKLPAVLIEAGDSSSNSAAPDTGPPISGEPPNDNPISSRITVPGYNHLDVVTAARRQNDGRPEPSSKALTDFALSVTR